MKHLYKFNLLRMLREKSDMFWGLIFSVIMATLFFLSFGRGAMADTMSAIPAAAVKGENMIFETFLHEMDGDILELTWMEKEEAQAALKNGNVKGIYFCTKEPSLTVSGVQINESILQTLLDTFLQNQELMISIGKSNPSGLPAALSQLSDYGDYTEMVSAGGRTMDGSVTYFYALVGMACLFGGFSGLTSAINLRADQSALAARRSIIPVNRLKMVISEMLAAFSVQFANICLLLLYLRFILGITFGPKWPWLIPVCIFGSITGVSYGIFLGSLPMHEGIKNGILVGSSLLMSFLAGLMMGNMKDIIEHVCPIINRINPAALISDAFYSISVYENLSRYYMNLFILAVITILLTAVSFIRLRRERYDSL